jgi:hypothetical protein
MENFSKFFNSAKERFTPNTRKHHQNPIRSINRPHQNQVARYYGADGRKADPLIDRIVKNNKVGKWPLSPIDAQRILKTYGRKHDPNKNYSKSIDGKTGISITYDSNTKRFTISRQPKK